MPRETKDTTPEMPRVEDDEATRIDAKPPSVSEPSIPTVPTRPKFSGEQEDDEATKATGTPKKAREAQKILEESRRLNAAGGPKPMAKKLHPLIPLGVAFALLAVLLLLINWFVSPSMGPDGQPGPSGLGKLFDW